MNEKIHVWEKIEIVLKAQKSYTNPYISVETGVDLKGPEGEIRCYGFWDGGNTFRVRVLATRPGKWSWKSWSNQDDAGLNGKTGEFHAVEWSVKEKEMNPNRRGIIRATDNGHALEYFDGTPYFLIGDTWWSASTYRWSWRDDNKDRGVGPAMGFKEGVWFRKKQDFNCIAVIACFPSWVNDGYPAYLVDGKGILLRSAWNQWGTESSKDTRDEDGNRPFLTPGRIKEYPDVVPDYDRINPEYFKNLDRKINFLDENGFVCFLESVRRDAGPSWKQYYDWPDSFIRFLRYFFARYQASQVIFSPLHYDVYRETITRDEWKKVLDIYFNKYGSPPFGQLVTTNIYGSTLKIWGHSDEIPWLTLHQTGNKPRGHHIYEELTKIFHQKPSIPGFNGEPYYAGLKWDERKADGGTELDNLQARSAMYGNVLCGGVAGHIYGADGLWAGDIEEDKKGAVGYTVWEAIRFRSGEQMRYLKMFILSEGKKYNELVPRSDLLSSPRLGRVDYEQWSYCMRTGDKSFFLLYFEINCPLQELKGAVPGREYCAQWFDPRNGTWIPAGNGIVKSDKNGIISIPPYPNGKGNSKNDWGLKLVLED